MSGTDTPRQGRVVGPGLLVAVLFALGACGSDDAPLVQGVVVSVTAVDNTFRPADEEVANGTVIEWKNRGRTTHNIRPVDGGGWGVEESQFGPGATYQHRFITPGTYGYYCSLHGTPTNGMVGTIVVNR